KKKAYWWFPFGIQLLAFPNVSLIFSCCSSISCNFSLGLLSSGISVSTIRGIKLDRFACLMSGQIELNVFTI
uniref:Uncharacterized protein n=1 Tax=Aegilops tauschii subsp. strangulata TaxID=200361 RepID=A0A453SBV1_AEGTS